MTSDYSDITTYAVGLRPVGVRGQMAPGMCFRNAALTAMAKSYRYAEGYATQDGWHWVLHAWNVDRDGNAFDRTWTEPGRGYVGMTLDAGQLCTRDYERDGGMTFGPVLSAAELAAIGEHLPDGAQALSHRPKMPAC